MDQVHAHQTSAPTSLNNKYHVLEPVFSGMHHMPYLKPPAEQHGEGMKKVLLGKAFKRSSCVQATGSYIGVDHTVANDARFLKRLYASGDQAGRHKRRAVSTSSTNGMTSAASDSLHRNPGTSAFPTPECGTQRHNAIESTASMVPIDGHCADTAPNPVNPNRKSTPGRGPRTASNVTSSASAKTRNPNWSKEPKRFKTEKALNARASMKSYNCKVCESYFKHKNELERHIESLHEKRVSWSCSAVVTAENAFHKSPTRPDSYDACSYCGVEFCRSGTHTSGQSYATPDDWGKRLRHLQDLHKFQKCSSAKKFFRADHFRQHLKHSHGGTSGKWSNKLENTCMRLEDVE